LKRQRLALAVNLLLVLVVGVLVVVGVKYGREGATTSAPPANAVVVPKVKVVAPPACLEASRRADELIDLYTRHIRDRRLSLALKAYSLASQACRRSASS